ncbi:DUF1524 domain-containing protein [Pseudactinotalea sp. HY158]|nr:DUF1524 domain-containing protein [Pseudactinotalea sp. HY158]
MEVEPRWVLLPVSTRALDCGLRFPAEVEPAGRAVLDVLVRRAQGARPEGTDAIVLALRAELAAARSRRESRPDGPAPLGRRTIAQVAAGVAVVALIATGGVAAGVRGAGDAPGSLDATRATQAPAGLSGAGQTVTVEPGADRETGSSTPSATTSASPGASPGVSSGAESEVLEAAVAEADGGTALAALATLPIKGRAPKTGYDRDLFGSGWVDIDRNGCDTRNDILARDLTVTTVKPGTAGCVVLTGVLDDPYTATTIDFRRGQGTSRAVQIDHVVALSDAWQKGAQQLDDATRRRFANDPLNLLAVDGPANQAKGDGDAATWLPPNKGFRCTYVARQVAVKTSYDLWVTQAEYDAIGRVLQACPDEPLPESGDELVIVEASRQIEDEAAPTPVAPKPAEPKPVEPKPAAPKPVAPKPDPEPVYYKNCTAVRAAGAAPIFAGQPGYTRKLDRDGDGVGCE